MKPTYPPSPKNINSSLTKLPITYTFKALLAIMSVVLFFVLYSSMVAGTLYLVYLAIVYDIGTINKITIFLKVAAIAGTSTFFTFTVKFIFKLKNPKIENRIKLKSDAHPNLIDFINHICKETGAPFPKNIYVDPDVNAYVSYSNLWLSLLLPVKKDLTIGLGILDALNLTEFKAVMAHEFGHFSQRSMKIGSYIVSANTIIHDMIFDRDKWDEWLDRWRAADIRLSAIAWVITPFVWLIRQILNLFYILLNFLHSSLSREMEFNADKVAVKLTGSEAIISSLWKLEFASETWNKTMNNIYLSSQKNFYVENIYYHSNEMLQREQEKIQTRFDQLKNGENGRKTFFTKDENSKLSMYSSHPSNKDREENANTPFIEASIDQESPWSLFSQPEEIQKSITALIYKLYLDKKVVEFITPNELEEFILAENQGSELIGKYLNTFENRFLQIPSNAELSALNPESLTPYKSKLKMLKIGLEALMEPIHEIEHQIELASKIANGTSKVSQIQIDKITYNKKNIQRAYQLLNEKREKLFSTTFKEWDILFCGIHLALAQSVQKETELHKIYEQHRFLSQFYQTLSNIRNKLLEELEGLQIRNDVTQQELNRYESKVIKYIHTLNEELEQFENLNLIPLPNISTVSELRLAIVETGRFPIMQVGMFENGNFNKIILLLESTMNHCQRIDQKSIGFILQRQEEYLITFTNNKNEGTKNSVSQKQQIIMTENR